MTTKKEKVKISFVGENSTGVTGSCILVEYADKKILLECGLHQSNNVKKDYETNNRKFKFKPKSIDYVFLGHAHIDHSGLLPKLYKDGCRANIITTKETLEFVKPLLKDSAFIMQRDVENLNRKYDGKLLPIYEDCHVDVVLDKLRGYDFNTFYVLDDIISFMFTPNQHIIGSASLSLYIKEKSGHMQKILYTSDLGNIKIDKQYVEPFQPITKASVVIGECTYSGNDRSVGKKDRQKDLEKIKSVIQNTCIDNKGKVLIPSFSMDRSQTLLTILYELFGEDENFDIPIVVDSPLTCKITKIYQNILDDEDREYFNKVCSWENVRFISDADDSKACVADKNPKIILSSSGMMTAGRSVHYAKTILPEAKSTILFCGYSAENSLAYKIKNGSQQKTITIDGKVCANKCNIVELHSFTSHMQREDLLNYYSNINTAEICLVHGEMNNKIEFAKDLKKLLEDKLKTTKICVVNKSTVIKL